VWLGTLNTKKEAARAYDATVWRFSWPRHQMNFPEARSQLEAKSLTPEPLISLQEEARCHRQGQRWISIAEVDERFMSQCCRGHPENMETMRAFWKEKHVERRAATASKRKMKATIEAEYAKGEASALDPNDDQWLDIMSTIASEDIANDEEEYFD
jgi:hypothetical protein